jgi:hypothetical protein
MNPLQRTTSFVQHDSQAPTQQLDTPPEEEEPPKTEEKEVEDDVYKRPERRYPPIRGNDTVFISPGGSYISVHGKAVFVTDGELIAVHPVKPINDVVAVTKDGKHVVLQQAQRSCVPAAITCLALDLGGQPLYHEMRTKNLTSEEMELYFIQKAGFKPVLFQLKGDSLKKVDALTVLLAQGPGLLHISHDDLKGHVIVLDDLSLQKGTATFRDPYHGWMVTVKIGPFLRWIGERFIQFGDRVEESSSSDAPE